MKNFKRTMLFFVTCTLTQQTYTINAATNVANSQNQTTNSQLTPVVLSATHQQVLDSVSTFTNTIRKAIPSKETLKKLSQENQANKSTQCCEVAKSIGSRIQTSHQNMLNLLFHTGNQFISPNTGVYNERLTQFDALLSIAREYLVVIGQSLEAIKNLISECDVDNNKNLTEEKGFIDYITVAKKDIMYLMAVLSSIRNRIISNETNKSNTDHNEILVVKKDNNQENKNQQSNIEPTKAKEESKGVFSYVTNIFSNKFKTVKSWFGFTKGKN